MTADNRNLNDRGDGVSHYTSWDITGHQTMVGNARPWRDELLAATSLQRSGAGVSASVEEDTVDFAYNAAYHATFGSADAMVASAQLNHDKDLASLVYPHIHWWRNRRLYFIRCPRLPGCRQVQDSTGTRC